MDEWSTILTKSFLDNFYNLIYVISIPSRFCVAFVAGMYSFCLIKRNAFLVQMYINVTSNTHHLKTSFL